MPCSLYNTNGFGCAGCCHFVKSSSIALSGTTLTITIPNQTIRNQTKLCIALCQNIPDGATQNTTVQISVNGTNFTVINPCGNAIYGDQLRCRKVLHTSFATDTSMAVVSHSKLCCTDHGFPVIPVPATAAASVATTTTDAVSPSSYSLI